MNFGIGVGDVIVVSAFAWKLYKGCKDSSENFQRLSAEVSSLHVILKETEDIMGEYVELDASRMYKLKDHLDGCNGILKDLERLLNQYESLRTQSQRVWDRMKFGLEDLADVRSRLVSQVTLLTAFNTTLARRSLLRIEKRLNKFFSEVRGGHREGSVTTVPDVVETLDTPDVWNEIRRELEDVGITPELVEEHHDFIVDYIKSALSEGLDDEVVIDEPNSAGPTVNGSIAESSSTTIAVSNDDSEAELELKRKQAERPGEEFLQDNLPLVKKGRMDPMRMLRKLFQKPIAIIQAASDGDLDKVVHLISIGCSVNARDHWGWTALSMAAYGNHLKIARILLDHGADLYNIDVDGDTPIDLATNRGHSDILILFEQEIAERDRRAREEDKEEPRKIETM